MLLLCWVGVLSVLPACSEVVSDISGCFLLSSSEKGNKSSSPENFALTPVPHVRETVVTRDHNFIVLACDGLFDVMTNQEVKWVVVSFCSWLLLLFSTNMRLYVCSPSPPTPHPPPPSPPAVAVPFPLSIHSLYPIYSILSASTYIYQV